MSNEKKNMMVPELRFPEFKNEAEWKEVPISELGETLSGLSGKSGPDFGQGRPYVTYMQVFKNAWIDLSECGKVVIYENERQNELQYGDILITTSSETPEEVGFASVLLIKPEEPIYLNSFCFAFRPYNLKALIPQFSSHLFRSPSYRKSIGVLAQGSTRFNISKGAFLNLKLTIPKNETEQQKIASCLSSLDDLITAHTQKLDALKAHKKGLMQQLFPAEGEKVPKLRFEEFKGSGEWEEKTLNELLTIGNGRDYKHLSEGEIPVYGSGGYMLSVDDYLYDGESVCIGRKGTIDKPIFLTGKFWTVDTLFYTHSFVDCLPKFMFYIFQNIGWKSYNEAGGVPSLSKTTIGQIGVLVPKPDEQRKIADSLSSLDDLLRIQEEKIEQLKNHKKGLMQGLFPAVV